MKTQSTIDLSNQVRASVNTLTTLLTEGLFAVKNGIGIQHGAEARANDHGAKLRELDSFRALGSGV